MTDQELDEALANHRLDAQLAVYRAGGAPPSDGPAPIGPSKGASAMRGAAHGATFGLADEAYGLLGAIANPTNSDKDFAGRYADSRDYARGKDAEAQKANPWTYGLSEAAGSLAMPGAAGIGAKALGEGSALGRGLGAVNTALVAPKEASAMGIIARGAGQGALTGFGESRPSESPDGLKQLAADTFGGAALGGATAGVLHGVASAADHLAPDTLKEFAARRFNKAAGGNAASTEEAALLGQADEAGAPAVGWFSKASDIADAAKEKAQHFTEESTLGPTWRPFGGGVGTEHEIGVGPVDFAKVAADREKARIYQQFAESAGQRADQDAAKGMDWMPSMGGFAMSAMHGGNPLKHAATAAAVGAGTSFAKQRGNAFAGRAAQGAANMLESAPDSVGTIAGAASQYLHSSQGAQAAVHLGFDDPEQASMERKRRLRDAVQRRIEAMQEQGLGQYPTDAQPQEMMP